MQRSKVLIGVIRELANLIEEEAGRNTAFAEKLDAVLAPLPQKSRKGPGKAKLSSADVPDVYAEYQKRGGEEFGFWLRALDLLTLKNIVKLNGFDPVKASRRWTDPAKFVPLITEQVKARLRRGSGFMKSAPPSDGPPAAAPG